MTNGKFYEVYPQKREHYFDVDSKIKNHEGHVGQIRFFPNRSVWGYYDEFEGMWIIEEKISIGNNDRNVRFVLQTHAATFLVKNSIDKEVDL